MSLTDDEQTNGGFNRQKYKMRHFSGYTDERPALFLYWMLLHGETIIKIIELKCEVDLLSLFSRGLLPVLFVIEWTRTGHPTVGASLMWKRRLEESSLRSTSMKSPASPLRWVAVSAAVIMAVWYFQHINVSLVFSQRHLWVCPGSALWGSPRYNT